MSLLKHFNVWLPFMSIISGFLPIIFFVLLYVGSGIYFSIIGMENAFYQISPTVAIIPPIALGWLLNKKPVAEKMNNFLDGIRHRDIITMCIVFLLAGAFSSVTKSIGSVDSTVNLALSLVPHEFLLVGLFITSAFISTAIGTSMGTIATIAPVAAGLAGQGAFGSAIGIATVISGAMFGDNLSIISDTTIASVMSQEASMKEKLKVNAFVAIIASIFTIAILILSQDKVGNIASGAYDFALVLPYIFLISLAMFGVNVFVVLVAALGFAFLIGHFKLDYSIISCSKDIASGFASMQEIMILSLMVGGLSGLAGKNSKELATKISGWISKKGGKKLAQLVIAKMVSLFDILLANNTVAIVFSGETAREISKKHNIPPQYTAAWLDIFSCVFQGIIPYGAQVLLASSIAGVSPFNIIGHVYYCYILGLVSVVYILVKKV